ncbi:MAG: sulfatase-like hydrolase/transferase [Pirellulaceae bacterium]
MKHPNRITRSRWDESLRASSLLSIALLFGSSLCGMARAESPATSRDEDSRPNIVLIMADDVSWECFGCYGGEDYDTPRIDDLASKGVRFRHCYSTPICTTSRVKLMTGKYNFRNYTHFGYLNPDEKTFGNLMRDAGYHTAIAGKWQLNGLTNKLPGHEDNTRPMKAGFDEYMLWQLTKPKPVNAGGGERFWSPIFEHNQRVLSIEDNNGKYGPDMLCDFVCDFMERNESEPFFVYYPMVLVHDPFVPTPDTIGAGSRGHDANKLKGKKGELAKLKKQNFVAMVEYMDKLVGRVVDRLDSLDLLDNTIVMFTADNGTNVSITSQWQGQAIKGGKAGMKDMGTHVPFVAYWKDRTPVALETDQLIEFTDFYPTLAESAGIKLGPEDPQDGVSFYRTLVGEQESSPQRNWVLTHYQPYWNKTPGQFVRNQDFKLYRDGRLYHIGSGDLDESLNLQDSRKATVEAARTSLQSIISLAPAAPRGKGNKDTENRPTYAKWPVLPLPSNPNSSSPKHAP